ncbi:Imm5 family immunity protein [Bacteroides fragilis]
MIQEQITKLKEVVNQNSMGHLPLPYRVDLMKQIGNTLVVQKILCECCKKVYLLCEKMNGEKIPLHNILFDADKYLYKGKGNVESIFSLVEKWRNYAEQSIDSSEDMENWAIIALGYATRYDGASMLAIEDYYGEDDNAFDFESWNVDFICSIAYSGGNPFVEIGNVEKRKEYWLWYLDMVLAMYENPDKPYLKIKALGKTALPVIIPKRTQSWRVSNTSKEVERFINTLIQEVSKQTTSWDRITIEYTLILGCSITVFITEKMKVTEFTVQPLYMI